MKRLEPSQDETRLLAFIAEALQRHIQRDAGIQTACAGLQRSGLAVIVRIELTPGEAPPRVTIPGRPTGVPQWSEEDAEILRSLGIAGDTVTTSDGSAAEPGRRQPR